MSLWTEGITNSRPWAYYDYLVFFGPKTAYDRVYMLAWENPGSEVDIELEGTDFTANVYLEDDQLIFKNFIMKEKK